MLYVAIPYCMIIIQVKKKKRKKFMKYTNVGTQIEHFQKMRD